MGFYEDKIFPCILEMHENNEMKSLRKTLLKKVYGEVLEIGFGTGINLPYYTNSITKLYAVEPSSGMNKHANKRIKSSSIKPLIHVSSGEELPFKSNTFDSVVSTHLLCSVKNVDQVLNESYRVLKPGGKFYFIEHTASDDYNILQWQNRLNYLSRIIACGCELNRNIADYFYNSEFIVDEINSIPDFQAAYHKLYPRIQGFLSK